MPGRKPKKSSKETEPEIRPALKPETRSSIIAVVFLALAGIVLLGFFKEAGLVGQYITQAVAFLFGQGSFLVPLALIGGAVSLIAARHETKHRNVSVGLPLAVLAVLAAFEILGPAPRTGGYIGFYAAWPLLHFLGQTASILVVLAVVIVSLLMIFDTGLILRRAPDEPDQAEAEELEAASAEDETEEAAGEQEQVVFEPSPFLPRLLAWFKRHPAPDEAPPDTSAWTNQPLDSTRGKKIKVMDGPVLDGMSTPSAAEKKPSRASRAMSRFPDNYQPPPLNFLETGSGTPSSGDILANKNIIKRALGDFGIKVDMGEVNIGPSIAQYMLKPASGVNVERITALRRNLSLALSAHPIRIEAPIPGKPYVGIEIPNRTASTVRMRPLIELLYKEKTKSSLTFSLGRDVTGQAAWADIGAMPHLLVAGATGSGKSVAVNNIITSLLYTNSPRTLRLLVVDPKRVELTPYNDIPHLLAPVVVEAKKTINVLKWSISEMERRYQVLADAGSRDIASYNAKVAKAGGEDTLPFIVIIIDELADIMAMYKKEVEAAVVRLAQMARAVGLHLIASTQRPSTDVVTGLIKANIPVRIAFKVASQIDSRTILDQAGAEKLLGHGDMLFQSGDSSGLRRIQGAFISEQEVRRVTAYLRGQGGARYNEEVTKDHRMNLIGGTESDSDASDDALYEEAKALAIEARKVSASLLQRRLRVGYARAARLLDLMEERGIIGPQDGAKPREVLVGQQDDGYLQDPET